MAGIAPNASGAIFPAVCGEIRPPLSGSDVDDLGDKPTITLMQEGTYNPTLRGKLSNTP